MDNIILEAQFRIRRVRSKTQLSQQQFSRIYGIPLEKLKAWEMGITLCPEGILELLEYIVDIETDN